jgi:hypothetical protein
MLRYSGSICTIEKSPLNKVGPHHFTSLGAVAIQNVKPQKSFMRSADLAVHLYIQAGPTQYQQAFAASRLHDVVLYLAWSY